MAYKEPEWASHPSSSLWTLTEIKGGVEVARHDLSNRATTLLGRQADTVHVPLLHESISRLHARISFDARGNPWLRDLQSAHGTFVNKRKLPPAAVGKEESNSRHAGARGILLSVGDMIKLGASSRCFSLEGPPPESSEEETFLAKVNHLQQKAASADSEPSTATNSTAAAKPSSDEGISWGIDTRDETDNDDYNDNGAGHENTTDGSGSIELDPLKIPEKYRKELDKLNALKYKLANLETEDNRIRRKGELTEGQQKQLNRNAERESVLRKSIQEREERLRDKLDNKTGNRATNKTNKSSYDNDGDDDDFFDRTKNDSKSALDDGGGEEAESEETLTLKWKKFHGEQEHLTTTALRKADQRVNALKNDLKSMLASGDEEAFFVKNDLQLAVESKNKIESSLATTNSTLDEIEKLLRVVNPKIHCDRTVGFIGKGKPPGQQSMLPPPSLKFQKPEESSTDESRSSLPPPTSSAPQTTNLAQARVEPLERRVDNTSMPPPPLMMRKKSETNGSPTSQSTASPATKRKRVLGPVTAPPSKSSRHPSDNTSVKSRSNANHVGTLSFLDHLAKPKADERIESRERKTAAESKQQTKNSYLRASVDPSQMDVWRAPEGQDGSGKTKLNEKFAGRY